MSQTLFTMAINTKIRQILQHSPVIPVITIDELTTAVPLAKALVAGGIKVLEITLRSHCALEAIALIQEAVPEAIVGAGTVTEVGQLMAVKALGVDFVVTPGLTPHLLQAALAAQVFLLPGITTLSEIMQAMESGLTQFKFFPAAASGGVAALKAFQGPLAGIQFCPTGGINLTNAKDYLALTNVMCIGGSWLTPQTLIKQRNWLAIELLTKETVTQLTSGI